MTTQATHISVAHGDGVTLTVTPTDDGRWFRILNWLIDGGHWSRLTDAQRNTLIVIARHRRGDGLASVSIAALCGSTGLRESAVYEAVKGLLAHEPPLLCKHGPSNWELFPGRRFAGRVQTTADDGSPSPDSAIADPIPPWRKKVRRGGPDQPPLSSHSSPPAPKEIKTTTRQDETERVVALLMSEGFEEGDARRMVRAGGPAQVRKVIANADAMQARARQTGRTAFTTSRNAYIFSAIRDRYALFSEVAKRAERKLAEKISTVPAEMWPLDPATTERINRKYAGSSGIVRAGLVSEREIDEMDAIELVGVIARRAEA